MALQVAKIILLLVVLLLPFQLVGVVTYFVLMKSDPYRADIAVVLVPAAACFAIFFLLFLWCYFNPGMMIMVDGAVNLFVLIVAVVGTALNLVCGVIVRFILRRSKGSSQEDGETVPQSVA